MTPSRDQELETDLEMVAAVPSIPAILRLIRQQANMGFVAVARVTPTRWLACSVLDEVGIGLQAGSELDVHATLCKEHLATLHAASQLLTRSADAGAARVGTRLLQSANRMLGLINDLVDYARGRAGAAMPIQLGEHAELGAALQEVVDEVRDANPGRDIRSDIDIPRPVRCEPARLQQLLSHLLGNAIAHGAAGEPILVHASEADGRAVIRVNNRGATIPAAQLARVFDAYWQAVPRRVDSSMGLGLHICQLVANAHGGTLTARSDAETGTTFELRWPSGCEPDAPGSRRP